MLNKIIISSFLLLLLNSCATPTVINVIGPNDNKLNCAGLSAGIAKANQYGDEAKEAKKFNKLHNIGALLFFFPGAGVTMINAEEAVKAANDRALHLNRLKEKKEC